MEASRYAYKRNIILNSVRQRNHFITQGNFKATCFDYRFLSVVSQDAVHTLGSQSVHSTLWLSWQNMPEDDKSVVETCGLIITLGNKVIVLTYTF